MSPCDPDYSKQDIAFMNLQSRVSELEMKAEKQSKTLGGFMI
jgi:hypothetical protein